MSDLVVLGPRQCLEGCFGRNTAYEGWTAVLASLIASPPGASVFMLGAGEVNGSFVPGGGIP